MKTNKAGLRIDENNFSIRLYQESDHDQVADLLAAAEEHFELSDAESFYITVHPNNQAIIAMLKSQGCDILNLLELRKRWPDERQYFPVCIMGQEYLYEMGDLLNRDLDENETLAVGDAVQLKSGGTRMTVEKVDVVANVARCVWFHDGEMNVSDLELTLLMPVDAE